MISLPFFCHFSLSNLHVSQLASKTSLISFTSHFCFSIPFTLHIFPLLLSSFLFCKVFIGEGQTNSLCCLNTFLRYLRFSNLCASSPKPPNDLICPTFFCCQPPFTFTYFSIISCLFTHPYPFQKLSNSFSQIAFSLSPITFSPPSDQTWFILFKKKKKPLSCFLNVLNSFFLMLSNVFYPLWPHFFTSSLHTSPKLWSVSFYTHFWSFFPHHLCTCRKFMIFFPSPYSSLSSALLIKHTEASSNMWHINVLLSCPVFRSKSFYLGQGPLCGSISPSVYHPSTKISS